MAYSGSGRTLRRSCPGPFRIEGRTKRRSEEHTSELQSQSNLVCRLLLEKKKKSFVPRAQRRCVKPVPDKVLKRVSELRRLPHGTPVKYAGPSATRATRLALRWRV